MRFYTTELLKSGMRLARPIYNKKGVLLYDRGAKLTDPIILNIRNFNLIGVFVLEDAEPLPPITDAQRELEQLQTTYMFRLRDCLVAISKGNMLPDFHELVAEITEKYGVSGEPFAFSQLIRSIDDYTYKHSVCTAILCALIAAQQNLSSGRIRDLVAAALLADFGYLYVPKTIMGKDEADWTNIDSITVDQYREKALALLKPEKNPFLLSETTLHILNQSLKITRVEPKEPDMSDWMEATKILMVADKYDRMTAMSLSKAPQSSIFAYKYMKEKSYLYDSRIVTALGQAVEIVSPGQSITLNTHTHAIVLYDNAGDADRPVLLDLRTNQLIDLGDSKTDGVLEIADVTESLDPRYDFDEETIKQFTPDEALTKKTKKIRVRLLNANKRASASAGFINKKV